jgi:hypothetical protein
LLERDAQAQQGPPSGRTGLSHRRLGRAPVTAARLHRLRMDWRRLRRDWRTHEWLAWEHDEPVSAAATKVAFAAFVLMVVASLLIASVAAGHPSFLSPTSRLGYYPLWLAGPLGPLMSWHSFGTHALEGIFTWGVAAMYIAYIVVLICSPRLRPFWPLAGMVLLQVIWFLSPPMPLTDIFNYLNYGRMEVVHHLNPYTTIPELEPHTDPTFALSNWHGLESPYGPLFTLITFAVVPFGLAGSYWVMKTLLLATSLAGVYLLWRCADLLGRNRLGVALFLGLNPIVLVWGMGADHNDFLMMLVILAAMYLLLRAQSARSLARAGIEDAPANGSGVRARVRTALVWLDGAGQPIARGEPRLWWELGAGVALAAAIALKASAAILLPVMLAGATRRIRLGVSIALGLVAFAAAAYVAFGANPPDLAQQSSLVIPLGLPNVTGYVLGFGGETIGWRTAIDVGLVAAIAYFTFSALRDREWIVAAGWTTFALLLSLSWVLPWYLIWMLPFAALAPTRKLRVAALVLGVYLFLGWMPYASTFWRDIGINPSTTITGRTDARYLHTLLN